MVFGNVVNKSRNLSILNQFVDIYFIQLNIDLFVLVFHVHDFFEIVDIQISLIVSNIFDDQVLQMSIDELDLAQLVYFSECFELIIEVIYEQQMESRTMECLFELVYQS